VGSGTAWAQQPRINAPKVRPDASSERNDLSFADFDGARRSYTAPTLSTSDPNENTPGPSDRHVDAPCGIANEVRQQQAAAQFIRVRRETRDEYVARLIVQVGTRAVNT